jgi:hypothetical protein
MVSATGKVTSIVGGFESAGSGIHEYKPIDKTATTAVNIKNVFFIIINLS